MTEREELELIIKLIGKYDLPLSPILEYAVKEKMEEFPALDTANEDGEEGIANHYEDDTYNDYYSNNADFLPKSNDVKWFCLSALACLEGQLDKRSFEILNDMLKGISRSEIADRHDLTQERIRQIVVKATKQAEELLIEQRESIDETKAENAQLNVQLKLLREEIINLKALLPKETIASLSNENEDLNAQLAALLETPLVDIALPVRAENILQFMGIKKFADIPQINSSTRLLKEKNSGKKTVYDISRMLEEFHLTFGMTYTEIVNTLNYYKDWRTAKRKWIRETGKTKSITNQNNNDNNEKTASTGNDSNGTSANGTQVKGDKRIGYKVKLFPSQQVGEIVKVSVDGKGIKKLMVRTNEGNIMAIDDIPYLYEILKRDAHPKMNVKPENQKSAETATQEDATVELTRDVIEAARTPNGGFTKSQLAAIGIDWPPPQDWIENKVGTKITPTQLEAFNRIEYVNPSSEIYKVKGSETYKDVASSLDERRKMEAILQAMTHFYTPATPHDIARTISRTAWGGDIVREETVDTFLKLLPEVEYVKWGKYILKSRSKQEETN